MDRIELSITDATRLWPGTRLYRIACPHGVSSAAVLPGPKPLADTVMLDLIVPGHRRRHGCACEPILQGAPAPAPHQFVPVPPATFIPTPIPTTEGAPR